jgi:glycosyltransferase involved in cell wall biosynthesis
MAQAKAVPRRLKPQPLKTRPTVSIVVPCYNYRDFLWDAVSSALNQPGVDLEVIIADNGSTDDSLDVARRLAADDPRIRIHTQPENINYLENFNVGLDLATGKYAQVLNADDMLTPGSLTRAVTVMENRPDVVFTYGGCPTFNGTMPKLRSGVRSWSIYDGTEWTRALYRSGKNMIRQPEVLMRTSTLRESGGFNADFPVAPDLLLWLRAAVRGNVARINGPDQALYRIHGSNMHLRFASDGWLPDLKGRQAVYDVLTELDPFISINTDDVLASRRALASRATRYARAALDSQDFTQQRLGDAYARYAREVWPEIVETPSWHRLELRTAGSVPRWWTIVSDRKRKLCTRVGGTVNGHLRRW